MKKNIFTFYMLIVNLLVITFVSNNLILNAETTYYNYEKVEVSELPEASENTLDKVYIANGKYYITNKEVIGSESVLWSDDEDMNNKTIYLNFPTDTNVLDNILTQMSNCYGNVNDSNRYAPFSLMGYTLNDNVFELGFINWGAFNRSLFSYDRVNKVINYTNSTWTFHYNWPLMYIKKQPNACSYEYLINFFSKEPFETTTTYSWVEVSKYDVYDSMFTGSDFPLFFEFSDIKEFSILSSYDLDNLNDFQKIVLLLGFNMFFLGFIGFIIYILIKFINKGVSVIFR